MKRFLFMSLSAALALVLAASCRTDANSHAADKSDTQWLAEAGVGAFMHFLVDGNTSGLVDQFDVKALADQLEGAGVGYFCLTLGQNTGYFCAPNPVYDRISGYKAGERTSRRDLPMELAKELRMRGIRMMLYLPMQTPNRDMQAVVNFGFPAEEENNDRQFTETGTDNWAEVISWWSEHYGEIISGWWFDGGYDWIGVNDSIREKYAKAAKSGNPHAIVCFNPGIMIKRSGEADDYTAGETADLLNADVDGQYTDGAQSHILSYLGSNWGKRDCRYETTQLKEWLGGMIEKHCAVTFDVGPNYDTGNGPVGTISGEQLGQLRELTGLVSEIQ